MRMFGELRFRAFPAMPVLNDRCALTGAQLKLLDELFALTYGEQWFWSLRKKLRTQADDENSTTDFASPIFDYDWTESSPPWIWQRQKMWNPHQERTFSALAQDSLYALCGNTNSPGGGSLLNPLAAGTGNIDTFIGPTVTTCESNATEVGNCQQVFTGSNVRMPPWHSMRFNVKKHIRMVRDNELTLGCTYRQPQLADTGAWSCTDPALFPFFPLYGIVTLQYYVRIAAVLRLN